MKNLLFCLIAIQIFGQSAPNNFYYSDVERTFVVLNWDAVSGVDGYRLYKDGVAVGTTTNTQYSVTGLTTETNYDLGVTSYIGSTESDMSVLPQVRTGLYPDEELVIETAYSVPAIPTNTTPYTNEFGLTERKVTQRSVEGDVQQIEKIYAKLPTWNRDGTELRTENPHDFYNGNTYQKLPDRTVSTVWGIAADNSSNRFNENKFQERSADGLTLTTVRTFSEYDNVSIAPTAETTPSWDNDKWAFEGRRNGQTYLFTYTRSTNTKHGEVLIGDIGEGFTSVSAYGNYAIAISQGTPSDYFSVYDFETLTLIHSNLTSNIGHADHQVSIQGNEVFVGRRGGELVMYNLETGVGTNILGGGGDSFQLGHASGKNYDQPGWIFFEDRNTDALSVVTWPTGRRVYRKVMAACLDENKSGFNEVLTRTYSRMYLNEINSMLICPDPSGQKVAFNNYSDNANYNFMEVYVAQRTTGENITPPPNEDENITQRSSLFGF
jgi:hypothetical protein